MAGRTIFSKILNLPRSKELHRLSSRTFLSDEYKCENAWRQRFHSPLLQKLNYGNLFTELNRKFQNEGKASPIDVDLFCHLVNDETHLEELELITQKFRRCPNTVHSLPSTAHAVIRTFLELKHTDTLMRMLDDRLNYGLFPSYYLSNLMMDIFLKQENYRDAVKVAIQLMLQEDFDHPITSHMALYSCYAYISNPQPQPWDPQPHAKPEEPTEVVKVRVDYIREPYFDDHFDLTDSHHLIGKTLIGLAKYFSTKMATPITKTSLLVGWMMYQKYDKVVQTLEEMLKSSSKPVIYKEWLTYCQKLAEQSPSLPDGFSEKFNSSCSTLLSESYCVEGNLLQEIHRLTGDIVKNQETLDIDEQLQNYEAWEKRRHEEVDQQLQRLEMQQRVSALQQKKKELEEKEEKVHFFDNIDKWELLYEEKEKLRQQKSQETAGTEKKLSSKTLRLIEEDNYVPPEVQKRYQSE